MVSAFFLMLVFVVCFMSVFVVRCVFVVVCCVGIVCSWLCVGECFLFLVCC